MLSKIYKKLINNIATNFKHYLLVISPIVDKGKIVNRSWWENITRFPYEHPYITVAAVVTAVGAAIYFFYGGNPPPPPTGGGGRSGGRSGSFPPSTKPKIKPTVDFTPTPNSNDANIRRIRRYIDNLPKTKIPDSVETGNSDYFSKSSLAKAAEEQRRRAAIYNTVETMPQYKETAKKAIDSGLVENLANPKSAHDRMLANEVTLIRLAVNNLSDAPPTAKEYIAAVRSSIVEQRSTIEVNEYIGLHDVLYGFLYENVVLIFSMFVYLFYVYHLNLVNQQLLIGKIERLLRYVTNK